ncbi:serine hydrolase [Mycobacterium sp. ITM-2016-00318]|uniref:serine hydrolase n=1 Tax=Mycobacterium sp. ITM-2016-00318 TaxID=2099693 RepID=UPI000CF9ED47|nr:serine hydrolase [Mycobacterium sp. ITM-2016-00318]WNG94718.1 serine hydrolase [Mycobacterium sp. ITM-2016-00318]
MRRRPSRLVAVIAAALAVAACEARSYGTPPSARPDPPTLTVVAPQGPLAPLPEAPPDEPASSFNGLDDRTTQATADAAAKGADITTVVLDRSTGQRITNGNGRGIAIASVVKLFIADDMLLRGPPLSPEGLKYFQSMLRSSDDSAAQVFWERNGGSAIVTRVAARYGLSGTRPNGLWFNTISTAADLVRYYDMMLSGAGGLPRDKADMIVDNLAQSTPTGIDGMMPGGVYPQRFGIPEGLYAEPVAVKQGWMCCVGADWMHLSTGIIGSDHRYVMAIASDQPATPDAARATITQAVKTMFPGGRI